MHLIGRTILVKEAAVVAFLKYGVCALPEKCSYELVIKRGSKGQLGESPAEVLAQPLVELFSKVLMKGLR